MDQLAPPVDAARESDQDDTLTLLFMCCHPELTPASAIALTLRAVGGLNTAEIAHAFLVPESTMAQRISRAKQSIKESGIPFQLPTTEEQAQRLRAVLHVLYLIFNEGYTSSAGPDLRRADLSHEAMRLTRIVHQLQPGRHGGRWVARAHVADRRPPPGANKRRRRVDPARRSKTELSGIAQQIAEGVAVLSATLPKGAVGPYQLQAAIAAVHDEAARVEDTDWPQILGLYDLLKRMSDNPMVALNRAIAAAMVHGPTKGFGAAGRPQNGCPPVLIITAWTLSEHICSNSLETTRVPLDITARRLARQGASPSETTSSRRPRESPANCD